MSNPCLGRKSSTRPVTTLQICQAQFGLGLQQKSGLLGDAVDQRHLQFRPRNRQRDAGQAAAAADIEHGFTLKERHRRQRIQQVMADHALSVAHRGQVVHPVPLVQQRQIGQQLRLGALGQCRAPGRRFPPQVVCCDGHALFFCSSGLKPRLAYTSSTEIAAGVMPCSREAWPSVSGRAFCRRWRTSIDNPVNRL